MRGQRQRDASQGVCDSALLTLSLCSVPTAQYNNSKTCDGKILSQSWFNRSAGYDVNCEGVDCSSKLRVYVHCDDANCKDCTSSSPFTEQAVVTETCQETENQNKKTSNSWTCTSNTQIRDNFEDGTCAGKPGSNTEVKTGCSKQNGVYVYSDIMTCNNP